MPPKPPSCFVASLPSDVIFSKFFSSLASSLKIAGLMPSTLLKMNFLVGIFQKFWPQISKHIYSRTLLSGCFRCLLIQKVLVLSTWRFFLSVLVSLNFSWVCWKPQKLSKWKFLKSLKFAFWYLKVNFPIFINFV